MSGQTLVVANYDYQLDYIWTSLRNTLLSGSVRALRGGLAGGRGAQVAPPSCESRGKEI